MWIKIEKWNNSHQEQEKKWTMGSHCCQLLSWEANHSQDKTSLLIASAFKKSKETILNPQSSHPMGDECSLLFSKHTFQVRFEVVSWKEGISSFWIFNPLSWALLFYCWLGFEVSPFILAFSLLAGVPFSPWWMRKQLFAFNLSYAQLFILTWLVLWLDA